MPVKGGVGASTLAPNVSSLLANQFKVRTLLIDADLASGTVQFQLNLTNNSSLIDAVRRSTELDESLWADLTGKSDQLDVLHAGGSDYFPHLDEEDLLPVLALARAQYSVICADLGTNFCSLTIEFLRQSRQVLLVTTLPMAASAKWVSAIASRSC